MECEQRGHNGGRLTKDLKDSDDALKAELRPLAMQRGTKQDDADRRKRTEGDLSTA